MKTCWLQAAAGMTVVVASIGLGSTAASSLETLVPGTLTVAVPDFPYPGFIEGTDPTSPTGGYYVDLANELGKQLGFKVKFVPADFTAFISGQFTAYDVAADSFSITPVRQEKFNMTAPVYTYHEGLMTKKGVPVSTTEDIRKLRLGSCGACDTFQFIQNTIKPLKEPRGFDIDITKYDGVLSGTIDGAIGDLPVILAKVATPKYSGLVAACQFAAPVDAAWILPKSSKIFSEVQTILGDLKGNGTFDKLQTKNIVPTLGGVNPNSVPKCASF
jgi:polar amino acid transport system substrate-binding protein